MSQQAKMMKQLQQVQAQLAKMQEDLRNLSTTGAAGGGAVKVTVNGHQQVTAVEIAEEALEEGAEMLADLVMLACNDALNQSRDAASQQAQSMQQALGLPPGLF